nr:AbrB family transcriptional regulator [uncultured Anaerostipes sp.]
MSKPMYRLVDGKGRVLIPKSMREAAKLEYGDIVCLGMAGGENTVREGEGNRKKVIEVGDQSPEAVEAYVRTAFQFMPDSLRLDLIGELSRLLQKKEG